VKLFDDKSSGRRRSRSGKKATLALNFDATALVQGKKDRAMTVTFLRPYDNYERQTDGGS